MYFQRFARFAATITGTTVITSATVATGIVAHLVDNYIGRNHIVNSLGQKIESLGQKIERLDQKIGGLDRKVEGLEGKLWATKISILSELQEAMFCTMKGIDGDKAPLREYVKRVKECKEKNYQGPDYIKGEKQE
ncbi:hypothetical protein BGX38DRAFT_1201701 [Terfezia claveryi]|nr:hypothetical protein BGX38DRAFT_1201701 [Terfezia claveryi]